MPANVEETKIAARYAKALFDQADEENTLEAVLAELVSIRDVLNALPDLGIFLTNPGIPRPEKQALLKEQMVKKVSRLTGNLLQLLVENDRISVFSALVDKYQALLNERNNVATAEVVTAVELDGELEKRLQTSLRALYGFTRVDLEKKVDPTILGGAIVKIQDKIIDGSLSGKLESLRKQAG